jgi:predicted cupin superfamily sugar epimerase
VAAGVWQAARSLGDYSLVGCTVGPGFDFADFQFVSTLPGHREHFIAALAPHLELL